ncbi:hypothetical protein KDA_74920 [Dictyobacter alpinus]|uniref:JAB domain-containing protein n=1 Tax=Dictyobacter alpinus TaxID=2014873 RepID=A0A402BKX1_9CHLR|nr:Mov34/MPN/PAD-1 family protein [Dictyobacter alpinus]GCE32008.1 hypothetical protein KDA_74920 [Dictyobacter alpinus]
MSSLSYHLLHVSAEARLEVDDETDLIVAGDGVYSSVRCFGMSIPFPLALCEIRGLLPLASLMSLFALDNGTLDVPGDEALCTNRVSLPFAPSHHVLMRPELPALDASRIYQYVIAGNGVFLFAGCPGLEVLMPISAPCHLPGLAPVVPYVAWKHPLVDEEVVRDVFDRARASQDREHGHMLERLFYLTWEDAWRVHEPEQVQSAGSVQALTSSEQDETALIEGHSHHTMRAYFSSTDDRDELVNGGFKVYFVIGQINTHPQIRTRVCVHGYAWDVPASTFFALPAGVEDCAATEQMEKPQ